MFLLSCVVCEPISGHLTDVIGTGLLSQNPMLRERKPFTGVTTHKTAINRPMDHTGET